MNQPTRAQQRKARRALFGQALAVTFALMLAAATR